MGLEEDAANLKAARDAALEHIRPLLVPGVVITHTRCLGIVEEHVFVSIGQGGALRGHPTRDTMLIRGTHYLTEDISPSNVTHINREPIELWLDKDFGKTPLPVEYQPSPEQAKADWVLDLIKRNSIRDRDAISELVELLDQAGPDLAIRRWERDQASALHDEVPF